MHNGHQANAALHAALHRSNQLMVVVLTVDRENIREKDGVL
jgi:hypothetical protein